MHCGCYDIFLQSVHTHPNSRTQSLKSSTPSFYLPDNPSMPNRANHATHNKVAMSDPHCQLAMYARYQLYSSGELKNQEGRVFGVSLRPKRHLLSGDLLWSLAYLTNSWNAPIPRLNILDPVGLLGSTMNNASLVMLLFKVSYSESGFDNHDSSSGSSGTFMFFKISVILHISKDHNLSLYINLCFVVKTI